MQQRKVRTLFFILSAVLISGCAPEVGSEAWCEGMAEKPKGDWSANEAAEFAKSCIFKTYDKK